MSTQASKMPKIEIPEGKFKLFYFNSRGRGFAARVALSAAGFDWEDARITFAQLRDLRGEKGFNDQVPLGTVPILQFPDGSVMCQSIAIARYAGKFSDLYPQDPRKAFVVDEIMDTCSDLLGTLPQDPDKEKKKLLRESFAKEKLPKYFELISRRLKESGGPFILGESLSIADLSVFSFMDTVKSGNLDFVPPETVDQWKNVSDLFEAVKIHPVVVASKA